MAKIVMHKNRNYTVMGNYHLRDKTLSNKARGLLSTMLSLPDTWDYTVRGLSAICKDGVDGIAVQLKELEARGYLVRRWVRDEHGRMKDIEYDVYEQPRSQEPLLPIPNTDLPYTEIPDTVTTNTVTPCTETTAQINTNQNKKRKKESTESSNYQSINQDEMDVRAAYEKLVKDNLEFDYLLINHASDKDRLEEIVQIILDAVCSSSSTLRVNGESMPQSVVKSRLLKLNTMHIDYVLDAMKDCPSDIYNIRAYLLTTLYNASLTIDNYYAAKVNHDFHGGP